AAVPPARGPPQGRREPRALPRDGRDRPPGVDGGALRPPGAELHVPGPRHAVRPPAVPAGPRVAGRRPRAQAPGHPEAVSAAAPAALDDRVDGPLGRLRGGARAPGLLLAAAAPPDPPAHGA